MKAIVVMFDSLNRDAISTYVDTARTSTPNFERLARRSVQFAACYAGSLPCMPARRELHTARYNFMHRSWGPLEPFDDSIPQMLTDSGVTTHLATDHMHYWEDGGATYHPRYGTFSLIRGQQGDPLHGRVSDPRVGDSIRVNRSGTWRQDRINRTVRGPGVSEHPQKLTFDAGIEFIEANLGQDGWFVQIETFDPHEPFDSGQPVDGVSNDAVDCDWPDYGQTVLDDQITDRIREHYDALVELCDEQLGRVLDTMDQHELWDDTLLIVCTDHGFLVGEDGWWGKSVMPWFEKVARTPLFISDPRADLAGVVSEDLVQTIDIGVTLLDFFGLEPTADMQGRSLLTGLKGIAPREVAVFGAFGGHVCVSDGRHVYMRGPLDESNSPLWEHTLMPTHMRGMFSPQELGRAELLPALSFSKGCPVLRVPGSTASNPWIFGTLLFDLGTDPQQRNPIVDERLELSMMRQLWTAMIESDAPASQFERLGLPSDREPGPEHAQCARDSARAAAALAEPPSEDSFPDAKWGVQSTVGELLSNAETAALLRRHTGLVFSGPFAKICSQVSLYRAATALLGVVPWAALRSLAEELSLIDDASPIGEESRHQEQLR